MGSQVLMREGQDPVLLIIETNSLYEACEVLGGEIEFETAFAFVRFDIEKLLRDRRWREWTKEETAQSGNPPQTRIFEFTNQLLFLTFASGQTSTRLEFSSPLTLKKIEAPISSARV